MCTSDVADPAPTIPLCTPNKRSARRCVVFGPYLDEDFRSYIAILARGEIGSCIPHHGKVVDLGVASCA